MLPAAGCAGLVTRARLRRLPLGWAVLDLSSAPESTKLLLTSADALRFQWPKRWSRTGICPSGDHVYWTEGRSEKPFSSTKTIVAPWRAAFLYRRPSRVELERATAGCGAHPASEMIASVESRHRIRLFIAVIG